LLPVFGIRNRLPVLCYCHNYFLYHNLYHIPCLYHNRNFYRDLYHYRNHNRSCSCSCYCRKHHFRRNRQVKIITKDISYSLSLFIFLYFILFGTFPFVTKPFLLYKQKSLFRLFELTCATAFLKAPLFLHE